MRTIMIAGLAVGAALLGGCTTRADVRDARWNLREAQAYGDRRDVREARRDLRQARRQFQDDNRCGPRYGRPCPRY